MNLFPPSWKTAEAKELCSEIVDCVNKTAPIVDYETPYKMIRTTNVKDGRILTDGLRSVDEATFIKWNRRLKPQKNDVVLTREAPLGDVGLIRTEHQFFLGQRTMIYRADGKKLNQHFLYYSLLGSVLQGQIRTLGSGSTVEHVRVPDAEKLIIPYPDLQTQKKIAAILSAYDDLIENNKRRIALLENMAEEIYREWFVRFRFPNYKNVEFEKGMPKGWEVKSLGEFYNTASGGTPSRSNSNNYDGEINWLKTGELKNTFAFDSDEKITLQGLESSSTKIFPPYTVVIAMYCAMPYITILAEKSSTNQACCAFLPKYKYLSHVYTYHLIKFAQNHMIQFAHGAAQQNLSQDLIKGFTLLIASDSVVTQFTEKVVPIFEQIKLLAKMNKLLERTKNSLLPRLISGKLTVENLNIQFPPSMVEAEIPPNLPL